MDIYNNISELPGASPSDVIRHVTIENMPEGRKSVKTMESGTPYLIEIIKHEGGFAAIATNTSKGSTEPPFFIAEGQFTNFKDAQSFAKGHKIGKEAWTLSPSINNENYH